MTTITHNDIRDALDADSSEYSDSDLDFEKRQAEVIVTDELDPYSDNTERLELTAALLAAAFAEDERSVSQVSQGDRSMSFSSDQSLKLFDQAQMFDPTDRLSRLNVSRDSTRYVSRTSEHIDE